MRTISILSFVVVTTTMAVDLPFKICKRSDPKMEECLKESTRDALQLLAKGLNSFKIMPIDPLALNNITIDTSSSRSVTIKMEYQDFKAHGLSKDLRIPSFKFDWNNLSFKMESFSPELVLSGNYKATGKVLLLPINGCGLIRITLRNLTLIHDVYHETFEKNGEIYLRAKKYSVKTSPQNVTIYVTNLIDGNAELSEQMGKFVNDNADVIFSEIEPYLIEIYNKVFLRIINKVLSRVPMDKLFPLM